MDCLTELLWAARPAVASLLLAALGSLFALAGPSQAEDEAWRYVASQEGDTPPLGLRLARLSPSVPHDVTVEAQVRGEARFTQIRYGTADSDRIVVMIDEHADGFDVYVDANRDRVIAARDRVAGDGAQRRCRVKAEVVRADGKQHVARQLLLKCRSQQLLYGTAGFVEGKLQLGSDSVAARRVDMDGNGLLTDPADRILLDLDGDGQWNSLTEQFPYRSVLRLGKQRYALASDLAGSRLAASEIEGTGQIRLQLADADLAGRISSLSVVLASRDGMVAHISRLDQPSEVPVGQYRLLSVVLTMTQPREPKTWTFVFSSMRPQDAVWHEVARDAACSIDPLGQLEFAAELERPTATVSPGQVFLVNPRLYAAGHLQLQTCNWGTDSSGAEGQPEATVLVRALQAAALPLALEVCGFA